MIRNLALFCASCLLGVMTITTHAQTSIPDSPDAPDLPRYHGRISVAPDAPYFVDAEGRGFLVIGQNDGVPWPGLNALIDRAAPDSTTAYVRDLRAHGITVSRVMIEYAQEPHTYLENPVGTFSPSMVQFWDDFIALAEQEGLYLLLTPYDTFWQFRNWEAYPYSAAMGGPCPTTRAWLTEQSCIDAHKARWRFIIERWGGSDAIFAWDIMNEIELWWEAPVDAIDAYITEMATYIRDLEMTLYGTTHLLTASSAVGVPEGLLGRQIYNHPALDFANTHLYMGDIGDPQNTIGAAPIMAGGVVLSRAAIRDNRPYFDSESGPINDWIVDPAFDKTYHHHMSWAHLAAGGAGSGMRWPYTNPHYLLPELRDNLLGLARFAATIDWGRFNAVNVQNKILGSRRELIDFAISDGSTAVVWLLLDTRLDETVSFADTSLTIRDVVNPGTYQVEYWDTYSGRVLLTEPLTIAGESVTLILPSVAAPLADLALIIRPSS